MPSSNPDGRPTDRGEAKRSTTLMLTPTAKAILKRDDNPIRQAGWKSASAFLEAVLRGEVDVPSTPG